MQIPAAPYFAPVLFKILDNVTRILAPEQPNGCPRETAPPLMFTLSGDRFKILMFASPTTLKASFNSKTSISLVVRFALFNAFVIDSEGAVVNRSA